ncbi:regulator of (H+)-ATPase in vacuolar membrane, partial [Rhizophlyctis rosea]
MLASKESHVGDFDSSHATYLTEQLTRVSLPRISNAEQLRLVALIDMLLQVENQKRCLDENGVRYMIPLRMFLFSQKSFLSQQRPEKLTSRDTTWAFFSESQDILMEACTLAFNNKLVWRDARALGMGLWVRNPETLRRMVETLARNQYMGKEENTMKDPVECALFYLALKKKNVLLGLWKLANGHPEQNAMIKFLSNDFETDRWKSAALKNAFALLGKQRYEYAVAFFLLGDKLKDAVNVCLKQLTDIQLAIIICRIYEGDDSPVLKEILTSSILPSAIEKGDRWLTCMVFTLLKQRDRALYATLMPLPPLLPTPLQHATPAASPFADPSLVILYTFLRKSYRSMRMEQPIIAPDVECAFIYQCASAYERLGCPGLALQIIRTTPLTVATGVSGPGIGILGASAKADAIDSQPSETETEAVDGGGLKEIVNTSATLDWGSPASQMTTDQNLGSNWGAPSSSAATAHMESSGLDWGAPATAMVGGADVDGFDWGAPSSMHSGGGLDWGASSAAAPTSSFDDEYEAFKKSLGGGGDDQPLEDLDLEELAEDEDRGLTGENKIDEATVSRDVAMDANTQFRFELETRNVRLYKWMLSMRIVQAVIKSASHVSKNMDVLSSDAVFRDYFLRSREGIRSLCTMVEMPEEVMDRLLRWRCKETDAILPFVEVLPLRGVLEDYAEAVSTFLAEQSNTLARLTFSEASAMEGHAAYLDTMSRRLLWALIRWQERTTDVGIDVRRNVMTQAAATAFVCLTVCSMRQRHYYTTRWLVGFSDKFFDSLLSNDFVQLKDLLLDLLCPNVTARQPDAENDAQQSSVDYESDEEDTDFDTTDEGKQRPPRNTTAALAQQLVSTVSLQHIGLTFDAYLQRMRDGANAALDETHSFLYDAILRRLSGVLFEMQKAVGEEWKKQGLRLEKVHKYLDDADQKEVWSLIRKTLITSKMLEFILRAAEVINQVSTAELLRKGLEVPETSKVAEELERVASHKLDLEGAAFEVVWKTNEIVNNFAFNPLDHNHLAIGTHKAIHEIDVDASYLFNQREELSGAKSSTEESYNRSSTAKQNATVAAAAAATQAAVAVEAVPPTAGFLKRQDLKRTLSFDSMQKALAKSMQGLRRQSTMENLEPGE